MALLLELPLVGNLTKEMTSAFAALPAPVKRTVAPFGGAYVAHAFGFDLSNTDTNPDGSPTGSKPGSPSSPNGAAPGKRDMGDRKKNVKLDEADLEVDWYDMLKLENGEVSTDDEIKTAYRRRCLDTHPDKMPDGSDVLFKKVQRAFEILGNPVARRSFDSSRPFDDAIPAENATYATDEEFYAAFGPVFQRNSKWSNEPMPQLGDNDTDLNEVRKMYDAWLTFRTWRDFSNEVELQDIDEGMQREEKRYYQRENQRLLDKLNRDELKRVRNLTDRAFKADPRLRRFREKEEAARKKILEERAAAKSAADDIARRERYEREEAEKLAAIEAKEKAINDKVASRNAIKEVADFLREKDLVDPVQTNKLLACKVRKPNLSWFLANCSADEAVVIREAIMNCSLELEPTAPPAGSSEETDATEHVPVVVLFNLHLRAIEERLGRNRYGEGIKKGAGPTAEEISAVAKPKGAAEATPAAAWTDEDLINLQKLAIKYPGGAVNRWQHIAEAFNGRYTEKQVLLKVKDIESGIKTGVKPISATNQGVPQAPAAPSSTNDEWTPDQQKELEAALREFLDYKRKDKWTKVAALVNGKNAKACHERFKMLCTMRKTAN